METWQVEHMPREAKCRELRRARLAWEAGVRAGVQMGGWSCCRRNVPAFAT